MPELPEVETIRLGLNNFLPKQTIRKVSARWKKSFLVNKNDINSNIVGKKIIGLDRRGKALIINLDNKYSLIIHLKMTGQLVYRAERPGFKKSKKYFGFAQDESIYGFGGGHPTNSLIGDLPDRSTRVIITFDKGKLFFNDQRKFGWIKLIKTDEIGSLPFFATLGPEPLSSKFSLKIFKQNLSRKSNSMIKPALLDQKVVAGIGNIYADESLFLAKIHPKTRVKNISEKKLRDLFESIKKSLKLSISHGGSSDRNYVNASGQKGSYLDFANVFRKDDQPCPVCKTLIKKIRVSGRGTHFCPKCQVKNNF